MWPRLLEQRLLGPETEALAHTGQDVLEGGGGRPIKEHPPEQRGEAAAEQRGVDLAQVDGRVEEAREAALAVEADEGHRGDAHLGRAHLGERLGDAAQYLGQLAGEEGEDELVPPREDLLDGQRAAVVLDGDGGGQVGPPG